MVSNRIETVAERSVFRRSIDVTFYRDNGDAEHLYLAEPLTFKQQPRETNSGGEPTVRLRLDDAQRLMDELWLAGLRPSEGTGSAGALAATQRHLEDMRRLTFSLVRDEQHIADRGRERGATAGEMRP